MDEFVRELETSGTIPTLRITASYIVDDNGNGVRVMVVKGRYSSKSGEIIVNVLFFKPSTTSAVRMTVVYPFIDISDEPLLPDVKNIMYSIKLLDE